MNKKIKKILEKAGKMRQMLKSVYDYNSHFSNDADVAKILNAMLHVDRRCFCEGSQHEIYMDAPLSIGEGQTISQPLTVARMLLLADLQENEEVLEVGAGSGWNACLAAYLVYPGRVLSIDRISELVKKAKKNVSKLDEKIKKKMNLKIREGNFFRVRGRYDKIIVTAGIRQGQEERIEELARRLLRQKGLLICPYVFGPLLIYKKDGKLKKQLTNEEYAFVPLLDS